MPATTPTRCSPSSYVASGLPKSQSGRAIDRPPPSWGIGASHERFSLLAAVLLCQFGHGLSAGRVNKGCIEAPDNYPPGDGPGPLPSCKAPSAGERDDQTA